MSDTHNELDKSIEELEQEVLRELEESDDVSQIKKQDVKTKKSSEPSAGGGQAAEAMDENPEDSGKEDLGGATPEAKVEKGADEDRNEKAIGKKASGSAKEISGDAPQKSEGKPMSIVKGHGKSDGTPTANKSQAMAAGDQVDHDGEELKEGSKSLTKAQHIENISKMKKADIEEMIAAHSNKLAEAENAESEAELKKLEDAKAEIEEKIKSINVKEDVDALTEGEDLSEEFKTKAATIFEAAVKSKIRSEIERIVEESKSEKEAEMDAYKDELTEKVDTYLNYVVEEWTKDNELAIERGLKGEIAEDFIGGLKQLFEDHYIDIPDEKYDVLEAQSEKIAELEEKLNETIEKNKDLHSSNSNLVREQVMSEVSEDLADTEVEKFKDLSKDVEFSSEDNFREKLNTLKESYFPKMTASEDSSTASDDDENTGLAQDIDTTDAMKAYMSAISRVKSA
tara:strand:- start:14478 stop:15842 length:1365 start_codon:yes stop_codon:yes gene_type:complete